MRGFGIEIENSTGLVVRDNTAIANTSGIVTFILPGPAIPLTEGVLIERNVVTHNNRPNPVLPSEDVVGLIPAGTGSSPSAPTAFSCAITA